MAYSFDQIFAADPANPQNVASNAAVLIYTPGDATKAPLTITDPSGGPLANPVIVNANGFGSAFMHATLDRVAWDGGGFSGFFTSYEGMKQVAVAAQTAAESAAADASTSAGTTVTTAAVNGSGRLILTKADTTTVDAGSVIGPQGIQGPPGSTGPQGPAGVADDTSVAAQVSNTSSVTRAALAAAFAPAAIGSAVTASRTVTATDVGKVLEVNSATDVTLTLPLHTAVSIPNGAEIDVVQVGAGRVYIKPTAINDYPDHPEAGSGGISPRNSATISAGAYGPSGVSAYRSTSTGTGSYGAFGRVLSLASLGYVPGDKISVRMWMNPSAGAPSATFTIRFKVGTAGTLSETTAAYISGTGERYVTNVTIPAGCDGVQLVVYNSAGVVGSTIDFGEIAMQKSTTQLTTVADGNDTGYFFTGAANASSSMGPLIAGEQAVPIKGRVKLRQASQGTWLSTPQGTPDNVLLDSDSLLVDRDNAQAGIGPRGVSKGSGVALVANTAYARRIPLSRRMSFISVNFVVGTASGTDDPVDVGLYSSSGTKLVSSGAVTGKLNSTGVKSVTIATTIVEPGPIYVVIAANSTATLLFDSFIGAAFGTAMPQAEGLSKVTSYPLPTTLTAMTVVDTTPTVWLRES